MTKRNRAMANTVKVIEQQSQTTLLECSLDEIEKAYQFAVEMEGHGIDVTIKSPSGPESLAESLGISEEDKDKLKKMLEQEIEDHEFDESCYEGCSMTPMTKALGSQKIQ